MLKRIRYFSVYGQNEFAVFLFWSKCFRYVSSTLYIFENEISIEIQIILMIVLLRYDNIRPLF